MAAATAVPSTSEVPSRVDRKLPLPSTVDTERRTRTYPRKVGARYCLERSRANKDNSRKLFSLLDASVFENGAYLEECIVILESRFTSNIPSITGGSQLLNNSTALDQKRADRTKQRRRCWIRREGKTTITGNRGYWLRSPSPYASYGARIWAYSISRMVYTVPNPVNRVGKQIRAPTPRGTVGACNRFVRQFHQRARITAREKKEV